MRNSETGARRTDRDPKTTGNTVSFDLAIRSVKVITIMRNTLAIIADDLTSALDGGSAFAARGGTVCVRLSGERNEPPAEVVSYDLDSRFDTPETAMRKAEDIGRAVAQVPVLYKTVDSTLRGNIQPEIRGLLSGSGHRRVVAAPAFPDGGRVTRNGRQWVNGIPVSESDFSRDIRSPAIDDLVANCFAGSNADITICDAETNADLDAIVAKHAGDPDLIWVGSPGLAAALARHYQPLRDIPPRSLAARRVLVVVGSLHDINRAQIGRLTQKGVPLVTVSGPESARRLAETLEQSSVTILATDRSVDGTISPGDLADKVGTIVAACKHRFDGLVVSGGDTARRIVDHLAGSAIRLFGETEPGIPVGFLTASVTMPIITKAGGFGDRDSLEIAARRLLAQEDAQ